MSVNSVFFRQSDGREDMPPRQTQHGGEVHLAGLERKKDCLAKRKNNNTI